MISLFNLMLMDNIILIDLYKIIQPIAEDQCDMVLGSRFTEKTAYKGSLSRRIGKYFILPLY